MSRPNRATTWFLLLALPFAFVGAATAKEPLESLLALDDEEHADHPATVAWWGERSRAEQIAILRRALDDPRIEIARTAAHAIGHPYLSSREIGRKVGVLLGDDTRPFDQTADWSVGGDNPLGAPLLVAYVDRALRKPDEFSGGAIATAHRVTRGEHIQALLPLLERAPPERMRDVLFLITNTGERQRADEHRAAVARGTWYGLLRLRAQRAGRPKPPLASVPADVTVAPEGGGIPPVAKAIARACERDATDGFERMAAEQGAGASAVDAGFWVRRWLRDCTPAAGDIPFLHHVIDRGLAPKGSWPYYPTTVSWAMGHLAGFPGKQGVESVRAWATGRDRVLRAWFAATALAKRGDRAAFDTLRAAADAGQIAEDGIPDVDPTWFVDRTEARERAAARLRRLAPNAVSGRIWLSTERRPYIGRDLGLHLGEEDLGAIAARLWEHASADGGVGVLRLAHFHTHIHPASLTVARATTLLAGLRYWLAGTLEPATTWYSAMDPDTLDRFLALCEVRDPVSTRTFLRWWATQDREGSKHALERLARLGGSDLADAFLAHWADEDAGWEQRWLLGLVPGDAVTTFLREKALGGTGEVSSARWAEALDALHAWLLRSGLPRAIAPLFETLQWLPEDDRAGVISGVHAAWAAALAGDPVIAVLRLAEVAPHGIHALGALDDPRVTAWLEDRRRQRDRGLYWEATMALAGRDPNAARDVLGLIRAGRTWLMENLQGGGLRHVPRDVLVHDLTAELDTNCCLGWIAHVLLKEVHPWLPFDDAYGGAGTEATRAYLAGHAWRHSEIFGGPVPAPR